MPKFSSIMEKDEFPFIEHQDPKFQKCEICYKDNIGSGLKRISKDEERFRCTFCDNLINMGNEIPNARYIYASDEKNYSLNIENKYYLVSAKKIQNLGCISVIFDERGNFINDLGTSTMLVFAKTYTRKIKDLPKEVRDSISTERDNLRRRLSVEQDSEKKQLIEEEIDSLDEDHITMLEHLADSSKGAKFIAALRMDADNMGKLIYKGFYEKPILESLSSFSRNVNYFFKFYLESLCKGNGDIKNHNGKNVNVIYAGGDDLFILGSWSDTTSLAIDIGETFKKYTCGNIDIGLSGGLTIHNPKFPVSKMAETSMSALKTAKDNQEPCWMCRNNWLECPIYNKGNCMRKDSFAPFFTEYNASLKKKLDERYKMPRYSQEPSRLKLALKWKRYDIGTKKNIDEVNDFINEPLNLFKKHEGGELSSGFFHNVMTLLNTWYDEGVLYLPRIVWVLEKIKRQLKRKIDPESGESFFDLYDMYLHLLDNKRFSTLHLPLSWIILLKRGGEKTNED